VSEGSRPDPFPADAEGLALSRWLDGRASSDEARRIEARLVSDSAFADEVARVREAVETWRRDASAAAASAGGDALAARVLASVGHADPETERFRMVARRTAIAASTLLAVGVGGSVWTYRASHAVASPPPLAGLAELRAASERYVLVDSPAVGSRSLEGR
jgi:anti-sigma factor RsiW